MFDKTWFAIYLIEDFSSVALDVTYFTLVKKVAFALSMSRPEINANIVAFKSAFQVILKVL
jgi:hypothetical protein